MHLLQIVLSVTLSPNPGTDIGELLIVTANDNGSVVNFQLSSALFQTVLDINSQAPSGATNGNATAINVALDTGFRAAVQKKVVLIGIGLLADLAMTARLVAALSVFLAGLNKFSHTLWPAQPPDLSVSITGHDASEIENHTADQCILTISRVGSSALETINACDTTDLTATATATGCPVDDEATKIAACDAGCGVVPTSATGLSTTDPSNSNCCLCGSTSYAMTTANVGGFGTLNIPIANCDYAATPTGTTGCPASTSTSPPVSSPPSATCYSTASSTLNAADFSGSKGVSAFCSSVLVDSPLSSALSSQVWIPSEVVLGAYLQGPASCQGYKDATECSNDMKEIVSQCPDYGGHLGAQCANFIVQPAVFA
ncbi:hypothetical protein P7C71_g3254, partial [Lecanoromycetidae sp. Uapishka_2]